MQNMLSCLELERGQFTSDIPPTSWVFVSHVCHHWREVAVSSGRLWSKVFFIHPDYDMHCLERSGRAPLHVDIDTRREGWDYPDVLPPILNQLPRIRTFHLQGPEREYSDFVDLDSNVSWITQPAPILESLIIDVFASPEQSKSIAETVLARDLPSLKELVVQENSFAWWRSSIPSTLSTLEIDTFGSRTIKCEPEDTLVILRDLPLLETLILRGALPTLPSSLPKKALPFPKLNYLELTFVCMTQSILFFDHLSIPPTAYVSIEGGLSATEWSTHSELITSSMVSKLSGDGTTVIPDPLLTFAIYSGTGALAFTGWTERLSPSSLKGRTQLPLLKFTMVLDANHSHISHSGVVEHLVQELPLSSMEVLSIEDTYAPALHQIQSDIFQRFNSLRCLIVEGQSLNKVPSLLGARRPAETSGKKGPPFFPRLSHVELIDSADRRHMHHMLILWLVASLKVRKECEMELGRLVLRCCADCPTPTLESLRGVVGELSLVGDSDVVLFE